MEARHHRGLWRVRTLDVPKAHLSQVRDGGVGCGDERRRKVHHAAAAATASIASSIAACVTASITTSTIARVFEHQTLGEPAPQPMHCVNIANPVGGAYVCK